MDAGPDESNDVVEDPAEQSDDGDPCHRLAALARLLSGMEPSTRIQLIDDFERRAGSIAAVRVDTRRDSETPEPVAAA